MLFFLLFLPGILAAKPLEVSVQAKAAILMNAKTKEILFEKNAHQLRYPASTMKLATALCALEKESDLERVMTASPTALRRLAREIKEQKDYQIPPSTLEPDGSHFSIKRGEKLRFEDLIYGLMLPSGNDASNVIAENLSGRIETFIEELNAYVKRIGCENTHFDNPHGLYYPTHMTTAHDLALIGCEAVKNPVLRRAMEAREHLRPKTNLQEEKMVHQHNALLLEGPFHYPRAFGMKTGYISDAGFNLVAAAEEGGRTLIAVLMGSENKNERYRDAITLFDEAFSQTPVTRKIFNRDEETYEYSLSGSKKSLVAGFLEDVDLEYYPAEEPEVATSLVWKDLSLPIYEGDEVGCVLVKNRAGILLKEIPIFAQESVAASMSSTLVLRMKEALHDHRYFLFVALFLGVCVTIGAIAKARWKEQ